MVETRSAPADQDGTTTVVGDRWDSEELALITRVINSFLGYAVHHHRIVTDAKRVSFFALPSRHQQLLSKPPFNFSQRMQAIEDAIDTNSNCAIDILRTGLLWTGLAQLIPALKIQPAIFKNLPCLPGLDTHSPTGADFSKASSTVRHLYREWSDEGAPERAMCFQPLLEFLNKYYAEIPYAKKHTIKVLNPGCGLGRFAFELACAGYNAEGIEISYHMLFGSMHMMNSIERQHQYRIYPFVLGGSNHVRETDRMRHVMIPDICPRHVIETLANRSEVPVPDRLGISSGDFTTVFRDADNANSYDVLATIFFIDTAKNPLAYMETAANCIKPGGLWLNLGPLKWHFEFNSDSFTTSSDEEKRHTKGSNETSKLDRGIGEAGTVELSEEDLLRLLEVFGFDVIHYEEPTLRPTGYIHDRASMETTMFFCSFWVARKRIASQPPE